MGALSSFTKWNPHDDLLLKNAVEGGASLESLAKGAVNFSRRFTVRELEDRWRLLLYDLNTSIEASARIIDIEIGVSAHNPSKPGRACNSKVRENLTGRRKGDSLQCHYYAVRKKVRSESHKPANFGFLVLPSSHAGTDVYLNGQFKLHTEFALEKSPVNDGVHRSTQALDVDLEMKSPPRDFGSIDGTQESVCCALEGNLNPGLLPIWKTMVDDAAPTLPEKVQGMPTMERVMKTDDRAPGDDAAPKRKPSDGTSTVVLGDPSMLPEDDFIDFSSPGMTFTDDEELLFLDVDGDDDVVDKSAMNGLASMFLTSSPTDNRMDDDLTDPGESKPPDDAAACENESSSTTPGAPMEELAVCVLNTEDSDVPCNDDLCFAAPGPRQSVAIDIGSPALAKEGKTTGALQSTLDRVQDPMSADRDDADLIQPPAARDVSPKQESTMEPNGAAMAPKCLPLHPSELGRVDTLPAMSVSDQEEQLSLNDDDDYEAPSFSDVEAMILDMDLGPYDMESSLFTKEVSRYQCTNTKRTIIRLEQGARSYMNRAISSRGAFAVFYGRHLKYFIRSPEVLLGRETEDIKVDIDLGKEGRANKISRRQAIIKMDEEGCFHLKNIGKSSIFVNSKEVPAKKRINLCNSTLIEIKDMRFIFEVNEDAVRNYMALQRHYIHGPKSEFDFVYT